MIKLSIIIAGVRLKILPKKRAMIFSTSRISVKTNYSNLKKR